MGFKKKRVLITDDDQVFLRQMCMLMERMGLDVVPADEGDELLKLVMLQRPDLVMLDIHMTMSDGLMTLRYLGEDTSTSDIPVVIVSSEMKGDTIEACRELGANAFLSKPVDIWQLHGVLQDSLFAGERFRRKYLRTPYHSEVKLVSNGATHTFAAETISERGIYLVTTEPMPVGMTMELTVPLNDGNALGLKGNVIYHKSTRGEKRGVSTGMAVEFVDNDKDKLVQLSAMIKDMMTGDIRAYQEDSFA